MSSARLYAENKLGFFDAKGVSIPVAVSTFAREIYPVPRSWAEQAYPNLVYFNDVGEGQSLRGLARAAAVFTEELRAGFRSLRVSQTMLSKLHMPSLGGATEWLNSEPLGPAQLRGRVVLVDFWTFTCINWLRTAPYVRAWFDAYRKDGLVVIGVHSPEFSIEYEIGRVRIAIRDRGIKYPVAIDNDFALWNAFDNHYWPALYFVDSDGSIPR